MLRRGLDLQYLLVHWVELGEKNTHKKRGHRSRRASGRGSVSGSLAMSSRLAIQRLQLSHRRDLLRYELPPVLVL